MLKLYCFRIAPPIFRQAIQCFSASPVEVITSHLSSDSSNKISEETSSVSSLNGEDKLLTTKKPKRTLVSAAFEKLKDVQGIQMEVKDSINKMISEAKNVEEILSVVTSKKLTRHHALKLVSVLADWTVEGKVRTSDFEKDQRFVLVCSILGSHPAGSATRDNSSDLNTVLGVASDEQAAKAISEISLAQMVKVLSSLASRKRRSTPLLRSLAHNIASNSEKLDIKQAADALYAVASLNFHDEMLIDRICSDLCLCLMDNTRRAVIGSIITSLGILRYKHIDLLNMLCYWVEAHIEVCTRQDLTSLVMTLATVHHLPANEDTLFPLVLNQLEIDGVCNPVEWLDVVWAVAVLNKQSEAHLSSVLSPDFIDKIQAISADGLSVPTKLKLLNINGVAKLRLKDYKGPLLSLTDGEWKVAVPRSKEKQALVSAMQETMLNLLPSAVYLATNTDPGMGFLIDAECLMNTKLTPIPLLDKKTKAPIDRSSSDSQRGIKLAIFVLDYHDMTRGRRELTGVNKLCHDLARLSGYRVMSVDHLDFNPRSKLVNQVQYLSNQLKAAIGKS